MKRCKVCGELKPLEDFYAAKGMRDGRRNDCKICNAAAHARRHRENPEPARERARQWQRANPERHAENQRDWRESGRKAAADRKSYLRRKYGITPDDYDRMLAEQGGVCAICGRPPRDDISFHVDHVHGTRDIRGLLCFRCNNALGDFEDDTALLRTAAGYVEAADVLRVKRRVAALKAGG